MEVRVSFDNREVAFLIYGTNYYSLARHAAFVAFGVCPILFHYAVEMFLKAIIIASQPNMSASELNTKLRGYGHALGRMWTNIKLLAPHRKLERLDRTIGRLDQVEFCRYPEVESPVVIGWHWDHRRDAPFVQHNDGLQHVFVSVDEVDELVFVLWQVFGLPIGTAIRGWDSSTSGLVTQAYEHLNRFPIPSEPPTHW